MSLKDLLKRNKKDIFQEYANNMQPLQPVQPLEAIQVQANDNGGVDFAPVQAQSVQAPTRRGLTLIDRLFGVQATPTDNIDTNNMNVTISSNPRVGGLLNDIASGAKENFATGFAAPNLLNDKTSDGRNKGFAYRLGEGLGTIGRVLESPLGRGLITAGIVGATGGSGLEALAYGGQAGALNQRLRHQDRMFRNEMIANAQNSLKNSPEFNTLPDSEKQAIYNQLLTNPDGTIRDYNTLTDQEKAQFEEDFRQALANRLYQNQQEQLGNITNSINNMRGYVTDDVYKNFVTAQQLRDNADYRNLMANLQMQNNQALQDFRKDQAEYQRQKDIADRADRAATRAITMRGQDINYGLGMARLAADANKLTPAEVKMQQNLQQGMRTINTIQQALTAVKTSPKSFGLQKGLLPPDLTNRLDPNGVKFRAMVEGVAAEYQKYITGVQASDAERKRYERFIPNPRDNSRILTDKLNGMLNVISAREGIDLGNVNNVGSKKVGKYTVRVK